MRATVVKFASSAVNPVSGIEFSTCPHGGRNIHCRGSSFFRVNENRMVDFS
jgi:hypothetical protein